MQGRVPVIELRKTDLLPLDQGIRGGTTREIGQQIEKTDGAAGKEKCRENPETERGGHSRQGKTSVLRDAAYADQKNGENRAGSQGHPQRPEARETELHNENQVKSNQNAHKKKGPGPFFGE